ncbi:MAG: endoglucanase [Pirellulaceae bacterium]|nr:MAG: endoglucanase [Pirellulaceae bacterium]
MGASEADAVRQWEPKSDTVAKQFFRQLVETPRPSGYEQSAQEHVRRYAADWADQITTDVHGNVVCCRRGTGAGRLMLAGHCDQIGMLVSHIDDNGFLYFQPIGGWDSQQLIGQHVTVWGNSGAVAGVIARKPIHLLRPEERDKAPKLEDLWVDIGAKDRAEAEQCVRIGDPITLYLELRPLRNELLCGPGMDNASGVWVVLEALRRVKSPLCWSVFAVSTVQEEIGLRGAQTSAFGVDPQVAIAVDVTHATDSPGMDKNSLGRIRVGAGPVIFRGPNMNPRVVDRLLDCCRQADIPFQLAASGRAMPNDANPLQVTRAGVATGLVSIPNRYMHSAVEIVSWRDLDAAAELLARFAESLAEGDSFIP